MVVSRQRAEQVHQHRFPFRLSSRRLAAGSIQLVVRRGWFNRPASRLSTWDAKEQTRSVAQTGVETLATSKPNIRYELLEELAQVARKCRYMVTGPSPEAMRFQALVEALTIASQTEPDDATDRLLKAIARSEDRGKESL